MAEIEAFKRYIALESKQAGFTTLTTSSGIYVPSTLPKRSSSKQTKPQIAGMSTTILYAAWYQTPETSTPALKETEPPPHLPSTACIPTTPKTTSSAKPTPHDDSQTYLTKAAADLTAFIAKWHKQQPITPTTIAPPPPSLPSHPQPLASRPPTNTTTMIKPHSPNVTPTFPTPIPVPASNALAHAVRQKMNPAGEEAVERYVLRAKSESEVAAWVQVPGWWVRVVREGGRVVWKGGAQG